MKTIKNKQLILALAITATLAACSSSPVDRYNESAEEQLKAKNESLANSIESAPKWFLNPPKNNSTGIFAVGMASSPNVQFSKSQAQLQAEFDLAKKYGQKISGQERSYMASSGSNGQINSDASQVIDKFVAEQDISGYEIVSSETTVNNGQVTTYVLLHLPFDGLNRVKQDKNTLLQSIEANKAYNELNERVQASKSVDKASL